MTLSCDREVGEEGQVLEHEGDPAPGGLEPDPRAESKSTRPPTAMRPSSGSVRPAMQRSIVVLPAPEGPTITVTPGAAANVASSWNDAGSAAGVALAESTWSSGGAGGWPIGRGVASRPVPRGAGGRRP